MILQIDPLKIRCSQKQQYPERKLSLKVLRKSSSLEKVGIAKVIFASAPLKKNSPYIEICQKHLIYAIYGCNNSVCRGALSCVNIITHYIIIIIKSILKV